MYPECAPTAAAAQVRDLDLVDDVFPRHVQRLLEGLVAVAGQIGVDRRRAGHSEAAGQHLGFERAGFVVEHFWVSWTFRRNPKSGPASPASLCGGSRNSPAG